MDIIKAINSGDRDWTSHRYILSFGAYGWTRLMVWANNVDDALDECIDWIAKNEPGLLCNDAVEDAYKDAVAEGMDDEQAQEAATVDTVSGGNCSDYISASEWLILAVDPTRSEILELQERL